MGNITQLKNGNFLINMGSLNRVIEITPGGKVVWDCFTEKLDSTGTYYHAFSHYRVSTCSSLYPNVFSVKPVFYSIEPGNIKIDFTITNVGTEIQSYVILALDKNKEIINSFQQQTGFFEPGNSRTIEVKSNDKRIKSFIIRANGSCVSELISLEQ